MAQPNDSHLTRIALLAATGFITGCLILALGLWLAAGRLVHAIDAHATAVNSAGQTIAQPQIRIIDPVPIKEPVKIRGIQDDGSININAAAGKDEG